MQSILEDLGADPQRLFGFKDVTAQPPGSGGDVLLPLTSSEEALPETKSLLGHLAQDGLLFVELRGQFPSDDQLAALRNRLCPIFHVIAIYRTRDGQTKRTSLSGNATLSAAAQHEGTIVTLRTRSWVMSPAATVEKFDQNADGWNGDPKSAGYAHFRWMRKHVALFADGAGRPSGPGKRVLDFGCGAGWVGIEAARKLEAPKLCFFDPSPEMVRIATENAHHAGLSDAQGRTGFGEDPPFPADGEEPFDLVISSGVLSFSPDLERWFQGVDRATKRGGTLIIGDIDPNSRGFARRRRSRPLLPVRELNGRGPDEVRARLEALGFTHRKTAGYQLTFPVPEMMHVSAERLGGVLNPPLLWANKLMAGLDGRLGHPFKHTFDSWVMHFDAPPA